MEALKPWNLWVAITKRKPPTRRKLLGSMLRKPEPPKKFFRRLYDILYETNLQGRLQKWQAWKNGHFSAAPRSPWHSKEAPQMWFLISTPTINGLIEKRIQTGNNSDRIKIHTTLLKLKDRKRWRFSRTLLLIWCRAFWESQHTLDSIWRTRDLRQRLQSRHRRSPEGAEGG